MVNKMPPSAGLVCPSRSLCAGLERSGAPSRKHHLRGKAKFVRRFKLIIPVQSFCEKYISFVFSEFDVSCSCPASMRGTLRDRHERWVWDAVAVSGCSAHFASGRTTSIRTAKSCGPGASVLALSATFARCRDAMMLRITRTGARMPIPGEITYKP